MKHPSFRPDRNLPGREGRTFQALLRLWTVLSMCLGAGPAVAQPMVQSLRVVAVYDMSAVASVSHEKDSQFFWKSDERVSLSCGPERAPSGLGRPEAELMALRETPVLAILVEHLPKSEVGDAAVTTPIRADRLRLYVDIDDGVAREDTPVDPKSSGLATGGPVFLYPAVLPLNLDVKPKLSTVMPLLGQTLFFQTSVQLCTEHKLGRAWSGANNEGLLDEAFLRRNDIPPGEAFFRGQGRPIAAQLGPVRWSLDLYAPGLPRWLQEVWGDWPGDVQVGNTLVEADIWGARAPRADRELVTDVSSAEDSTAPDSGTGADTGSGTGTGTGTGTGSGTGTGTGSGIGAAASGTGTIPPPPLSPLAQVPFRAGQGEICAPQGLAEHLAPPELPCLVADPMPKLQLTIELSQSMLSSSATRLRARVEGMPDAPEEILLDKDVLDDARADDIVARLPRYLPHFRSLRDPERSYTLLLVPDWQIARALGETRVPEGHAPNRSTIDAVGYLLSHLDVLHLQHVPTSATQVPDLMSPLRGIWSGLPGYSPGLWAVGAPVLLPADQPGQDVTAVQHQLVYKSQWVLLEGFALFLMMVVLVSSLPRIGELWQEPPVERAAHWPGEEDVRGAETNAEDARTHRSGGADDNA